ncbi:hypothetical protein SRHO_G00269880 [Serrasalmus rhombeus]
MPSPLNTPTPSVLKCEEEARAWTFNADKAAAALLWKASHLTHGDKSLLPYSASSHQVKSRLDIILTVHVPSSLPFPPGQPWTNRLPLQLMWRGTFPYWQFLLLIGKKTASWIGHWMVRS